MVAKPVGVVTTTSDVRDSRAMACDGHTSQYGHEFAPPFLDRRPRHGVLPYPQASGSEEESPSMMQAVSRYLDAEWPRSMESSWSKNSSSRSMRLPRDTRGEALIPASRSRTTLSVTSDTELSRDTARRPRFARQTMSMLARTDLPAPTRPTRLTTSSRRRPSATDVLPPRARLRSPWSLTLLSTAA